MRNIFAHFCLNCEFAFTSTFMCVPEWFECLGFDNILSCILVYVRSLEVFYNRRFTLAEAKWSRCKVENLKKHV